MATHSTGVSLLIGAAAGVASFATAHFLNKKLHPSSDSSHPNQAASPSEPRQPNSTSSNSTNTKDAAPSTDPKSNPNAALDPVDDLPEAGHVAHSISHSPSILPSQLQPHQTSRKHGQIAPPSASFHVVFVRHAESTNNVLSDKIEMKFGKAPFVSQNGDVNSAYEGARSSDPALSDFGKQQASLLPLHPTLNDLRIPQLAQHGRVMLACSPLDRAMQTARPLALQYKLRCKVLPDWCEYGGHYSGTGASEKSAPGRTRAELEAAYPDTHDVSRVSEQGWWQSKAPGREPHSDFLDRLDRCIAYLQELAWSHYCSYKQTQRAKAKGDGSSASAESSPDALPSGPDYFVIISHGDFLNAFLTRLLKMQDPPRYAFAHENTACTHIELSFALLSSWQQYAESVKENQPSSVADDQSNPARESLSPANYKFCPRVRRLNIPPVPAHPPRPSRNPSLSGISETFNGTATPQ